MSDPDQQSRIFGRILVQTGFLTEPQLEEFMRQLSEAEEQSSLGHLLVQRGILTPSQVQQLLHAHKTGGDASEVLATRGAAAIAAPAPRLGPPPVKSGLRGAAPSGVGPPPGFGELPTRVAAVAPGPVAAAASRGPLAAAPAATVAVNAAPPPATVVTASPGLQAASGAASRVPMILEAAERKGASDVHFHAGAPPAMRVEGRLGLVNQPVLEAAEHARQLVSILTDEQRHRFEEHWDLDFAFVTPGGLRCRANMYRTHLGVDATFRLLRRGPQALEELGLPASIANFTQFHQGLVLVTGPAGCGKSTTLAALVDLINADRTEHVLVLEDPIEIVHPVKKALVNQRQVGRDTESFARALRGALREDPDVIVIGELRDRESISLAVTAAETGHLVLGSMHTNSASRTIARLIDAFPPSQQAQVRAMLSESLRGVVSQRLVAGLDGRRIPAAEVLVVNHAIGNLIREGKLFQVRSAMQTGRLQGMRTMDDSLRELVVAGRVASEEARKYAESPATIPAGATPAVAAAAASAVPAARAPGPATPTPGPARVPAPGTAPAARPSPPPRKS